MIARYALPFSLHHILDRVGLAPAQQRRGLVGRIRLNRLQGLFAALGDWSSVSDPSSDRPVRFRRFCPDCREDTAHDGFDEFGTGWYAQICCCRQCGRQGMSVWPLAWW